ncbi:hypothetical protein [Oceanobacillus iheyensis HTE831]|uniref:Uncharacterized protein n=1 Tax=Oceanobacillus iheyensis (strain DSM 14371 / CIP 107618 / JCM 11309 / KCTC 3954 / HTE831) TaxID=221109 RepID=Q8EQQ0_OCEIH|nr:hypothetical protein [Oceanobacillus iheyensis HTE831]
MGRNTESHSNISRLKNDVQLQQKRQRFHIIVAIIFLAIFLSVPLIISLIDLYISFVWIFIFSFFPLTWIIGWLYWRRMNK